MNKNLEATRAWYEEHDLLEEFYKKYVCADCRYRDACTGVNGETRMSCNGFEKRHATKAAQSAWSRSVIVGNVGRRERCLSSRHARFLFIRLTASGWQKQNGT